MSGGTGPDARCARQFFCLPAWIPGRDRGWLTGKNEEKVWLMTGNVFVKRFHPPRPPRVCLWSERRRLSSAPEKETATGGRAEFGARVCVCVRARVPACLPACLPACVCVCVRVCLRAFIKRFTLGENSGSIYYITDRGSCW